jgi:hypothetical protein
MSNQWTTAYSILDDSLAVPLSSEGFLWMGIIFLPLAFFVFIFVRRYKKGIQAFAPSLAIATLALTMIFQWSPDVATKKNQLQKLKADYERGQFQTVTGEVAVLRTQQREGHASGDLVEVSGVQFDVDHYSGRLGYKKTIAWGGCLTNGARVRLRYRDNTIIGIDLSQ